MRGWFDLFRSTEGGPTLYTASNRTPVSGDATTITLCVVFGTLYFAFFVIFPAAAPLLPGHLEGEGLVDDCARASPRPGPVIVLPLLAAVSAPPPGRAIALLGAQCCAKSAF